MSNTLEMLKIFFGNKKESSVKAKRSTHISGKMTPRLKARLRWARQASRMDIVPPVDIFKKRYFLLSTSFKVSIHSWLFYRRKNCYITTKWTCDVLCQTILSFSQCPEQSSASPYPFFCQMLKLFQLSISQLTLTNVCIQLKTLRKNS